MCDAFTFDGLIRSVEWWHTVLSPLASVLVGATVVGVREAMGYDD